MNVSDYFLPRSYSKIQSTYCFFLPPGLYSRRNWKERVKKSFLEVHKMLQTVKNFLSLSILSFLIQHMKKEVTFGGFGTIVKCVVDNKEKSQST